MKKTVSITFLLLSIVCLFVSSAETKRSHNPLFAAADLSVTKVDTPDPVNTGTNLTYTITVTNNGPDAAANASWSDTLPSGTTFVSMPDVSGWSCTSPDPGDVGTVSCSNPSFAVGSAVFSLTVAVGSAAPAGSVLSNTATAMSSTPDGNPGNESGTATTTVRSPATVAGNKSRSGGTSPGTTVDYLVVLSNSTGSDQQDNPGDEFTDVLPAGLTLVSAFASSGATTATVATNTVTWNGIVPPAPDTVTISISATINSGTTDQTISNQGTISYDADGNGTNEASASTNSVNFVVGASTASADLGVTKSTSADTAPADSDVTYTISVNNGGPDTATSATLTDTLPGNMTFVSLSQPAGWSCNSLTPGLGGTLTCSRDLPIASGVQVFTLVGHIPSGTANDTFYLNVASVTTTATDSTSENNSSSAGTTVGCLTNPVVTTSADSGPGSLRRAIQDACVGGTVTFDMTAGHVTSPITLTTAELLINKDLTIQGPEANLLTVQRSSAGGTPAFRIFDVAPATVSISGLTISNGNGTGGGAILNQGTLTLIGTTISANDGVSHGGGIENGGGAGTATLTIVDSTISGNTAGQGGGGIYNRGGTGVFELGTSGPANLSIINSTITGNTTFHGGGIFNDGQFGSATLSITNGTISGNTASAGGGGIYSIGIGGTASVTLGNTIISDNAALNGPNGPDIFNFSGTISGNDNIIETAPSSAYSISGSNNLNVDPMLEKDGLGNPVLKNNGGPTRTILLLPVSPAINAGSAANLPADSLDLDGDTNTTEALPIDQRGFGRVFGANPDIGAVETNYTITTTAGTPQSAVINSAFATLQVNVKESGTNQNGITVTFTAPGSGASGTFPGSVITTTATTNASGNASAPTFTANGTAGGPYNVVASIGAGLPTATFALTNSKAATSTAVSSAPNPSNSAQSVTFTATVTSTAGTPTGTVQFKDGGSSIGPPQALNGSGVATFSTSSLTAGIHTITADYNGDANFIASTGTLSGGQQVGAIIRFSSTSYDTIESSRSATITVQRIGELSSAATVDYATPDDSAATPTILPCSTPAFVSARCDFTTAIGTLKFAANETTKTFEVLISQDNYVEGPEPLTLTLSNPSSNAALGPPSTATLTIADDLVEPAANPIDESQNFVRQHYHDFLNREPDPADLAGLNFWTNEIESCGANQACRDLKRQNVSGAFFLAIEFQESGYYVYRSYKAAFGDINPPTVPAPLRYREFIRDTQEVQRGVIVGQGNWQALLDSNQQAYALAFVKRPEFLGRYPAITSATAFVDTLNINAGSVLTPAERTALISELSPNPADDAVRASVLMKVAENALLKQQEMNRAFVLMQYFGYLRRNPDAAPEAGLNFGGYNFWLNKLNSFNGNFIQAEMVKAFINSSEYRKRFGQ